MATFNRDAGVALAPEDRAAALTSIKTLLRVTSSAEDDLIATLAEAALTLAERFLGQTTIARAIEEVVAADRAWRRLSATPVAAITAVSALDPAGAPIALDADQVAIDIDEAGDGWVRLVSGSGIATLTVSVDAGLAAGWNDLPRPIAEGAAMLAAHLYDHRDGAGAPPAAVTALWRPYRRMRLGDRAPA